MDELNTNKVILVNLISAVNCRENHLPIINFLQMVSFFIEFNLV